LTSHFNINILVIAPLRDLQEITANLKIIFYFCTRATSWFFFHLPTKVNYWSAYFLLNIGSEPVFRRFPLTAQDF
jgi:hypothetical protein